MAEIKVTRFGGKFIPTPQNYHDLRHMVELCDDLYPGIDIWFKKKVLGGLKEKDRIAYVIYENDKPVAASISKLTGDTKICSFRVIPKAEKRGIGELLMALVARDLRPLSKLVHFTIPEHVWHDNSQFFQNYGLNCRGFAGHQYRLFDKELYGWGSFNNMWSHVIRTLPKLMRNISINGFRLDFDLVMSIHPTHANSILNGQKRVEIRRRFSNKWIGSRALVYSTHPEGSFLGSFVISNVVEGNAAEIWRNFGTQIGCNKDEYDGYTKGASRIYAIIVGERSRFKEPMHRNQLSHLVSKDITVPQTYSKVTEDSVIIEATSVGMLLQSTL